MSLDQFGLKSYNFEVVYKYNIMDSLSHKLNLASLELQGSQDVSFFCLSDIFLHCWTISVV